MKIKICGVTSLSDAFMAASAGADAVGLNFYSASPRAVTPALAADIAGALPLFVEPVGVFVNASAAQIQDIAAEVGLRTVQLHGDEPADIIDELGEFRVIRAVRLRSMSDIARLRRELMHPQRVGPLPSAILADAHADGAYGGTGATADWSLLAEWDLLPLLILAGGLTPDNVAEAIRTVRPYAVDVATGVESSPGREDPAKLRAFIHRAHAAFASLHEPASM